MIKTIFRYHISIIIFLSLNQSLNAQISFSQIKSIEIGYVEMVEVVDINNDSLDDIVVIIGDQIFSDIDNMIAIYINNGSSELSSPVFYPYSKGNLRDLEVADVNNDDLKDIILCYSDSIGMFYQNSSGTFNEQQDYGTGSISINYQIKTGDFNNDGLTDLVVRVSNDLGLRFFYQNSNGFDIVNLEISDEIYGRFDVSDLNDDGLVDLIFFKADPHGIHISYQNEEGLFEPFISQILAIGVNNYGTFTIGDLNNDKKNDIATLFPSYSEANSSIFIWNQDSLSSYFQDPFELSVYKRPQALRMSDLNCDGINEIVTVINSLGQELSVYEQDDLGNYGDYERFDIPSSTSIFQNGLAIGDINNDGRNDIVIENGYYDELLILYNNSPPPVYDSIYSEFIIDTLSTIIRADTSYYYSYLNIDTLPGYIYLEYDSLLIEGTFQVDEIRIDSLVIGTGFMCFNTVFDTLETYTSYTQGIIAIDSDTSVIVSRQDLFSLIDDFKIYPNPTSDIFTVEIPLPYDFFTNISVYNDLGAKVFEADYNEIYNIREIDLSDQPDGTYFVSVSFSQFTITKKVLKIQP